MWNSSCSDCDEFLLLDLRLVFVIEFWQTADAGSEYYALNYARTSNVLPVQYPQDPCEWANGESVPRPVIHTDGFHEWSGPWGGPSSRWAGQDGVGGSFGDGVRWVTEEDSDED